jgi:hypothetical protein
MSKTVYGRILDNSNSGQDIRHCDIVLSYCKHLLFRETKYTKCVIFHIATSHFWHFWYPSKRRESRQKKFVPTSSSYHPFLCIQMYSLFCKQENPNTNIEDIQRSNCQANDMTNNDTHEGSDLANLYTEVLEICEPFYELPPAPSTPEFHLSPRLDDALEDGLLMEISFGQANPQDPMSM